MDPIDNDYSIAHYDFENTINQAEEEGEVPEELARLLQQEEREIQPHGEPVETVNLGTEEDKKEVKRGVDLEHIDKERLI